MKQVYLFAILSMLAGWIIGDMIRPLDAHRLADTFTTQSSSASGEKAVKQLGAGTIEVAANLHDVKADKNLPDEVIDARTKAQIARERALKRALHKIFPQKGEMAMGGPFFPMTEFTGRPRPRPEILRTGLDQPFINTAFYSATPFPVFPGPGTTPWFAPGDPRTPPHMSWYDVFPGAATVPEPASWMTMILGFLALALRLRRRKAEPQPI